MEEEVAASTQSQRRLDYFSQLSQRTPAQNNEHPTQKLKRAPLHLPQSRLLGRRIAPAEDECRGEQRYVSQRCAQASGRELKIIKEKGKLSCCLLF